MSWGFTPWGFGPYGGTLSATTITVAAAWAISTHAVRVVLTNEPAHADAFAPGDATNVATWAITNTTTGQVLTVASASMHDATSVDVTTIEPLGDHLEAHTIQAIDLTSVDGIEITSPTTADFIGVVQTMDRVDAARDNFRDRDLRNPPFQLSSAFGHAGAVSIGDDGDFDTEAGQPLVRKLVLRRLNTRRGAFRHLPEYGVALLEKEPISNGGQLQQVLRDVEEQVKQEPDVTGAVARGSIDRSGVLIIQLSVTIAGSAQVNMRMGSVTGRLVEI